MQTIDDQIKSLLLSNDEKAFELIYNYYYNSLCRFALRYLDNIEESEDVVQTTLIKLWNRIDDFSNVSAIKTYLFRSIQNACLNYLRDNKLRKQTISSIDIELLEIASDSTDFFDDEKYDEVKKAIEMLPAQSKKILELNRFDGFSYKEIADQLNISHRTVDSHLTIAMRHLREHLKPIFITVIVLFILIPLIHAK